MKFSPGVAFIGWCLTTTICTLVATIGHVVWAMGLMFLLDTLTGVLAVEWAYRCR